MLRLAVTSTAALMPIEAQAQRAFTIRAHFTGASCDGPPSYAKVEEAPSCTAEDCSGLTNEGRARAVCSSELGCRADIHKLFGGAPYILRDVFGDHNCSEFRFAEAFQASDKCEQRGGSTNYARAHLDNNGTASVQLFRDDLCTPESLYAAEDIEKEILENQLCDSNAQKWYVSPGNSRALAWILITSDGSGVNGNDTSTSATITGGATSLSTLGTTDGTNETSSTLGVDDTAVSTASDTNIDTATSTEDSTADNMDDTSTIRDDSTTVSSRSGSSTATSNSIGGGSSEASTALINDTTASATTDPPIESTTSSSDTGSSSQGSASSTQKDSKSSRSSRVTITTIAPLLDTSKSTTDSSTAESVDNTVVADSSASGSRASAPVATAKASVGTGAIVGLVMGSLAVVILIIGSIVHRRRSGDDDIPSPLPSNACRRSSGTYWGQTSPINRPRRSHQRCTDQRYSEPRYTDSLASRHASFQRASSGQRGLWNDDVITTKRIPKDKVHVEQLLSRGAFGEVYLGLYNQERVAIKMLLPQTRGDIRQVNEFLTEAKMIATMEHPHIVTFIGVAWDSLSDVCVVLEYMDGDLRSLLSNYESTRYPVGFDREKVTIALHVCHALAYMHSLATPVIHRDLKSRNVLLNQAMEAKLTDFGVSRERLDRTMTAGVGTSLWMAPEVMMGEKYDDKADIFSFGVVLSELDMHALPYAKALAAASANNQMACAVLLQRVALGTLRVEFSHVGPRSMAELGCACVSVVPSERPTAAEILYTLQTILNRELGSDSS